MRFVFLTLLIVTGCLVSAPAVRAQTESFHPVDQSDSRYVVTDSAVFVYYMEHEKAPYKVYDFSTRSVYVYFGDNEDARQLAVHSFGDMASAEISYILDNACDNVSLSSPFKRFCQSR